MSRRAVGLTSALLVVSGLAALAGLMSPELFRDPPMWVGNARGTAAVMLFGAIPTVLVATWRGTHGSRRAQIIWLGGLAYLLYNAVIFAFAVRFNSLFLLYVAALSLSVWAFVAVLTQIDVDTVPSWFAPTAPVRAIGAYLVITAIAFAALWLKDILPAISANGPPASFRGTALLTNPVEILDLGFSLPLAALGGIWLWRRRPWGYLIAGIVLVMLTIEGASVATDQWFGHRADPTQSAAAVPLFIVLTLIGLVPTVSYLRAIRSWGQRGLTPAFAAEGPSAAQGVTAPQSLPSWASTPP